MPPNRGANLPRGFTRVYGDGFGVRSVVNATTVRLHYRDWCHDTFAVANICDSLADSRANRVNYDE